MQFSIKIIFRTMCSENKEEGLLTMHGKVGEASQERQYSNWVLKASEGSILVQTRSVNGARAVWAAIGCEKAPAKAGMEETAQ